jgi:hypothetical protein
MLLSLETDLNHLSTIFITRCLLTISHLVIDTGNYILSLGMGDPGLEPGTNRLKAEYSTIELVTLLLFFQLYQYTINS